MRWIAIPLIRLLFLAYFADFGYSQNPRNASFETPAPLGTPSRFGFKDHHLVFVSFDALQGSHVSALGYPRKTTPTLDEMAKSGYLFSQFHSVSSWTVPASMTWFTGVYPSEHRMVNKFSLYQPPLVQAARLGDLAPTLATLAQILKDNGYDTGGFTGNAGVSGGFGYEQGFDVYQHENGIFGSFDYSIPRAITWLKTQKEKKDQPNRKFFLFLHGYDVHGQCVPTGGYDYRFVDKANPGNYLGSEREQELLREIGLDKGIIDARDEDIRFWRAIYDEKIQRADAKFAQFLKEYARLGHLDKTIFILTSDHGTEFFEHGRIDHGFTLYQEQVRIPLIIVLPGQKSGKMIPERLSSIDIMPTLLELLEIPLAEKVQKQLRGKSLIPNMKGGLATQDLFCETDYREYTFKRALITTTGWKWIATMESGHRELYDLNQDPGETNNLAKRRLDLARDLEARLFAQFKNMGSDLSRRAWKTGLNPVYQSQGK